MNIYRDLILFCVIVLCIKDSVYARRGRGRDGSARTRNRNRDGSRRRLRLKIRRNPSCADNQVCSHTERLYTPWGEVENEKLVRNFCRCGGGKHKVRCMDEWDEFGYQSIYFMLPGDWANGVQIRQAGLCEYISKPDCEKGAKAVTYQLHTTTYHEQIEVHCECPNPLAPVLPMSHVKKGDLLVAEFKCNEYHRPPGDEAPWWGDKLYTGRR